MVSKKEKTVDKEDAVTIEERVEKLEKLCTVLVADVQRLARDFLTHTHRTEDVVVIPDDE